MYRGSKYDHHLLIAEYMDQPHKIVKPGRGQLYSWKVHIDVLVQYCCLYWFIYQVPVYFLFGDMYIRARFTVVV